MDDIQLYHAKVSVRTKLLFLKNIKQKLSAKPERLALFKSTVFGNWLNIKTQEHDNHLLHYLLQHQREVQNHDINTPFYFDIGQHTLEFGRQEMCLILRFRFGDVSLAHCHKRESGFGKRIMALLTEKRREKTSNIKAEHLVKILNDPFDFAELTADNAVRLCLLLILENIFMGKQERNMISNDILVLVDDFYAWNVFSWGEYIWVEFHNKIYNAVLKVRERHLTEIASRGLGYTATYTLCGFAFALKIWLLETFPNATNWWVKDDNVIPRALAWDDGQKFEKNDCDLLFGTNQIVRLMPTVDEENELWWRASLDYIRKTHPTGSFNDVPPSPAIHTPTANKSGARAKMTTRKSRSVVRIDVHRSTKIRTEVRFSVERVMRQVSEMPSSATIVAQMAGMQQQINQLRQLVAHLKPDGVTDMPDMGEDMPPNASLVSQMVYMQKQIDGLQKFLQHFKTDGVIEENAGSSDTTRAFVEKKSTKNDDNMDVDHDSKTTGIDVQEDIFSSGNDLSTQEVQEVVDNLVGSPEVEEDVHVKEDVPLMNDEQHVSVNEVMNETPKLSPLNPDVPVMKDDQHVAEDEKINDPRYSDYPFNTDVPVMNDEQHVAEDEKINDPRYSDSPFNMELLSFEDVSVNDLISEPQNLDSASSPVVSSPVHMVDVKIFDCDTNTVNTVRVPFERERKASKVYQDPYMQQPSTTPRVLRRRLKRHVPNVTPKIVGPNGKEISLRPSKENLKRNPNATMFKAFVHPEIMCWIEAQKKITRQEDRQLFRFPWGSGGTIANLDFWLGLLGRDAKYRGWLSDAHLGVCVDFMMHFRPANADWVMVGPFFCSQILNYDLPTYYADGVTNGIPWFSEGFKKVFFPINEPDVHLSLGELSISTGVISLYDSLGSQTDADLSEWSRQFRRIFQTQLPKLLTESEVMERKNLDPNSYSVSFRYAPNLPKQGGKYGDYGVWVIIFLYRLSQNLPLKLKQPVQAALAYREHLSDYLWKYKIPVTPGFTQ